MNIDKSHLVSLLGTEAAAQRFIDLFIDKLPEQADLLKNGFAEGDWETVGLVAHGLKSQFRYLGLQSAADLLQKIETDPAHDEARSWMDGVVLVIDNLLQD